MHDLPTGGSFKYFQIFLKYYIRTRVNLQFHQQIYMPLSQRIHNIKFNLNGFCTFYRQFYLQLFRLIYQQLLVASHILRMRPVEQLRQNYQEIRKMAYNNELKNLSYKNLKGYHDLATKELQRMQNENDFNNLEEVDFYNQKFGELVKKMKVAGNKETPVKTFTEDAKRILSPSAFVSRNPSDFKKVEEYAPVQTIPKMNQTSYEPFKNRTLQQFFNERRNVNATQANFGSLLQNPPISPRSFKKRVGVNNDEITRLRSEIFELKKQLQQRQDRGQNYSLLEQQMRRQQQKIRYLQNQNDKLSKDNTRLKSEKSVTVVSAMPVYDDYLYSPYIMYPRENNLDKISTRSMDPDGMHQNISDSGSLHNLPSFNNRAQNMVGNRPPIYETRTEVDDNESKYSVFNMEKSRYSDFGDSRNGNEPLGLDDPRSALRNKIAFFRDTGIILRSQELEIGYKRVDNGNLSQNRIIMYFNNKTGRRMQVRLFYEVTEQYYDLNRVETIDFVAPYKQGKEVVDIRLLEKYEDISSLIKLNIEIDEMRTTLWLPAMFLSFKEYKESKSKVNDSRTKTVNASKIFASEVEAKKVIPALAVKGPGLGYLTVKSGREQGPLKLQWLPNGRLEITTSQKWLDFVSFLFFDYR